jgi:hypothetical protein
VTGALKPGEYPGQIIQVQVKFSKCGNYEQHALRVRVEDAANDHWEDFWERLTFSDSAMWKVEQALGALGLDAGVEREIQPEDWLEKRCRVELADKEGKLQIKRWLPAKAPAQKPPMVRKFPDALERLQAAGRAPVAAADTLPF